MSGLVDVVDLDVVVLASRQFDSTLSGGVVCDVEVVVVLCTVGVDQWRRRGLGRTKLF